MFFRYLLLGVGMLCAGVCSAAPECARPGLPNPLGAEIARAALREYREFDGHRINVDGYLSKFGAVESESTLLHDPETGLAAQDRPGRFAWRRVWEYWLALDKHVDGTALHRKITYVPGLLERADSTAPAQEFELKALFLALGEGDPNSRTVLREAAVRAAMNDSPWSAAFISYLMDQVHLRDAQFQFSPAHWEYIKRAFEAPDAYAYRACDPRKTVPRVGDLLCYSRGRAALKDFGAWQRAVGEPRFSTPAHCDAVVEVDLAARKIETIGGNVLQSVTRRRLKLNGARTLSDSHSPERFVPGKKGDCQHDAGCRRENFNAQYWGVLLQLK